MKRVRDQRVLKHIHRWDNELDYRVKCSRKGMIRDEYATFVVAPWLAANPDDIPPDPPEVPLGIPRAARLPSK